MLLGCGSSGGSGGSTSGATSGSSFSSSSSGGSNASGGGGGGNNNPAPQPGTPVNVGLTSFFPPPAQRLGITMEFSEINSTNADTSPLLVVANALEFGIRGVNTINLSQARSFNLIYSVGTPPTLRVRHLNIAALSGPSVLAPGVTYDVSQGQVQYFQDDNTKAWSSVGGSVVIDELIPNRDAPAPPQIGVMSVRFRGVRLTANGSGATGSFTLNGIMRADIAGSANVSPPVSFPAGAIIP